jgi:UDP-glucose 4-epimerase
MRILVTGGLGYIGSHCCIALHQAGFTPVIYDNLSNSSRLVLDQLAKICGQHFDFIEADILDPSALSAALHHFQPEAVFHFAALKAVGESVQQPLRYYQNNVYGTVNLLQQMQQTGCHRLIFSSSATVYGDPQFLPLTEQHPIGATNPYGWSKVMSEQIMQDICCAQPSFLAIALRYFNPAGAHPSGLIGEDPKGIPNNLMPYVAQTAVGRRAKVQVFGNDYPTIDGTGVRDYIHVMDLAEGHVAAYQQLLQQQGFHAFNLGTGKGDSVLQLIAAFGEAAGKAIPYEFSARRPGDIAASYADATKARQQLGWQTRYNLRQMAADCWRWQTLYPNGLEPSNDKQ